MLKDLVKLANNLDSKNLKEEADALDKIIKEAAARFRTYDDKLHDAQNMILALIQDKVYNYLDENTQYIGIRKAANIQYSVQDEVPGLAYKDVNDLIEKWIKYPIEKVLGEGSFST